MRSTELYYALKELHQIPEAADELVRDLRAVYRDASGSMTEGFIPIALSSPVARRVCPLKEATPTSKNAASACKEAPPASQKVTPASKHTRTTRKEATLARKEPPMSAASKPPQEEAPQDEPGLAPRKAFKLVNAMITRRIQGQVGAVLNSSNTTTDSSGILSHPHTTSPAGDSTTSPSEPACTSSIPKSPLRRRPTFITRDTEIQDRMIRGQVVTTRRPSVVRGRGATFSERRVEMEAWWRQPHAPRLNPQSGEPGNGPNRKNTA